MIKEKKQVEILFRLKKNKNSQIKQKTSKTINKIYAETISITKRRFFKKSKIETSKIFYQGTLYFIKSKKQPLCLLVKLIKEFKKL